MASTLDMIVFDVNETLFYMSPVGEAFAAAGASA